MVWGDDIVLWGLLSVAAFTDLRTGKIYNIITLPAIALGVAFHAWQGGSVASSIAMSAVGVAFILFFPLYYLKIFGAGDVKLLMAVAAWTDTRFIIQMGMQAVLIGAVVGCFLLLKRHGFRGALGSLRDHLKVKSTRERLSTRMPFAPAFLCAFLWIKIAGEYQWSFI